MRSKTPQEVQGIEDEISGLLDEIEVYEKKLSLERGKAMASASDPIGIALRQKIRAQGKHLFDKLHSRAKVVEVVKHIANRKPGLSQRRAQILDSCFDSLGSEGQRWWR